MLKRSSVALCMAALLVSGCQAHNLYIAHKVNLGLNAAYNQEKPSGKLLFGYKEQFVTIIPKSAPIDPVVAEEVGSKGSGDRDAMSVLGCSDVKASFIEVKEFSEYLATGAAAKRFAYAIAHPSGTGADVASTKLFAYQLKDNLEKASTAVAALTAGGTVTGDPLAALTTLDAQLKAVEKKVADEIAATPDETLAPRLQILLKSDDLKTLDKDFDAVSDAGVKSAGAAVKSATLLNNLALAQLDGAGLDNAIFSCIKNTQVTGE